MIGVDPFTGMPTLRPRQKSGGGGGGGGQLFATLGTELPIVGSDGELFFNTTTSTLYIWVTSTWVAISGSGGDQATFDFLDGEDFMFIDGDGFDFIS